MLGFGIMKLSTSQTFATVTGMALILTVIFQGAVDAAFDIVYWNVSWFAFDFEPSPWILATIWVLSMLITYYWLGHHPAERLWKRLGQGIAAGVALGLAALAIDTIFFDELSELIVDSSLSFILLAVFLSWLLIALIPGLEEFISNVCLPACPLAFVGSAVLTAYLVPSLWRFSHLIVEFGVLSPAAYGDPEPVAVMYLFFVLIFSALVILAYYIRNRLLPQPVETSEGVKESLFQQARVLKARSNKVLFLVVGVLFLGFYTFIGANYYTDHPELIYRADMVDKLNFDIRNSIERYSYSVAASETEDEQAALREALDLQLENLRSQIELLSQPLDESVGYWVSVGVARIGSIIILVFLVQLLVALYRYTSRLAAFYDARGKAIELAVDSEECTLQDLVGILAPDRVEFEANMSSPLREVSELVGKIRGSG